MILSAQSEPWLYEHPWKISFEERLSALCAKGRRVAYFYENPDTSTFRYRVFNMVEALNSSPEFGISASWFSLADMSRMDRFIDQADVLVLCRTRYGSAVEKIFAHARTRHIPILFDVDDLVFDSNYVSLIVDSLDEDRTSERIWDSWFAYAGRYGATLRGCNGAITTNQYLADRIEAFAPGISARLVPNFLNRVQQQKSCETWEAKLESRFARTDSIHIGYFSGSPTHNHDFQVASSALAKIMDQYPNLVLRIVGFLEPKAPLSKFRDRIEIFRLQDFLNLQRLIGEVEINVAPLQNNVFTNCKSELKYFEAAIAGTLTIASPTFTFREVIRDGENGFLAAAYEWETKLRLALDAVHDLDQYSAITSSAHKLAVELYGWDRLVSQIDSAVFRSESVAPKAQTAEV